MANPINDHGYELKSADVAAIFKIIEGYFRANPGSAGVSNFTALVDAVDVDIPTLNIPVSTALGLKLNRDEKASQAEAEAGLDNTKWMTPLRVMQLLESLGLLPSGSVGLLFNQPVNSQYLGLRSIGGM